MCFLTKALNMSLLTCRTYLQTTNTSNTVLVVCTLSLLWCYCFFGLIIIHLMKPFSDGPDSFLLHPIIPIIWLIASF